LQASQGTSWKYFEISSRAHSLSVSFQRRSRLVTTPFERLLGVVGAHAVVIGELDLFLARALENDLLGFLGRSLPLGVERVNL